MNDYWLHMLMSNIVMRAIQMVRDARWRLTLGLVLPKI
jgi:hypothetical protein